MSNQLVSIIMPAFNAEDTINNSIDSVLKQTYKNWELIIIDDGSTDTTFDIITKYGEMDKRIKVFKNKENLKVAKTRNRAINKSKGNYIAFLDSDDMWTPDKIDKQLNFMINNHVEFSYANTIVIDGENREKKLTFSEKINYKELLKSNQISCLTVMIKKELIEDIRMQDIGHEDYLFWLEILKKHNIYAYNVNDTLGYYLEREASLSANKLEAAKWQWRIYREKLNLSMSSSVYYFIHYAVKGIIKKW